MYCLNFLKFAPINIRESYFYLFRGKSFGEEGGRIMQQQEYGALVMDMLQDIYCYICDMQTYDILYMNQALKTMLHLPKEETDCQKKCYELLQDRTTPCPFCSDEKICTGEKYFGEVEHKNFPGKLSVEKSLLSIADRPCRLVVAREQEKNTDTQNIMKMAASDLLLCCIQILMREQDTQKAIHEILAKIGMYYQGSHAYIFVCDEGGRILHNAFSWYADENIAMQEPLHIPVRIIEKWLHTIYHQNEPTHAFYLQEDILSEEFRRLWKRFGAKDILIVPLIREQSIMGFMGIDNPRVNRTVLHMLDSIAYFVWTDLEKRRLIRQLEYASYTDMLTGVRNRNKYLRMLQWYEKVPPKNVGIVFADVNGMKTINDTYGHSYGDFIIKHNAKILKTYVGDTLYRIGGDEFVAILEDIAEQDFFDNVARLRLYGTKDDEFRMALGATWQAEPQNMKELILDADAKMYLDKQQYYVSHSGVCRSCINDTAEK